MGAKKNQSVRRDLAAEKTAIETLRAKYPGMSATRLARTIHTNDFSLEDNQILADDARGGYMHPRTELSIYSVIRRYDAARANAIEDHVLASTLR